MEGAQEGTKPGGRRSNIVAGWQPPIKKQKIRKL
jgi:hypothetical protein